MEKKIDIKKILNIVKNVFVWAFISFAILMMIFTIISVGTVDKNSHGLFGYKFFIVQSDSMAATDFAAGDIVIVKEVNASTLKEGDIITFISKNPSSNGEYVTHKIREVTTDAFGRLGFVTYGTTTDTNDETIVSYIYVVGKYQGKIPKAGTFFMFLKTPPGYISCILVPVCLIILFQGINSVVLFRKYKREQLEEVNAQREKLERERAESQRMMAELIELKARLAEKEGEQSQSSEQPPET